MVSGAVLFSVGGLALVRKRVSPETLRENHDVAGFILAIVGVIYAVLLAFVVLVVWERYGEAEVVAAREANAVVDIYRLAPGFSTQSKLKIRAHVRQYAQSVVQKEWPTMARGEADDATSHVLDNLWTECIHTNITKPNESELLGQLLDRMTDISDNRRMRLLASRTGVPNAMWLVLIAGAVATITFTFYFGLDRFSIQAGMTAILAVVIALVLFLISALNYPFTGDLRVRPEAMEIAIERYKTIDAHEARRP
ncbi:hypothetical protein IAD21_06137 [Abditibacteriota bacterium]|nr:hypothetical protein IAD21_06137 [Abditibacteriota bacterium]